MQVESIQIEMLVGDVRFPLKSLIKVEARDKEKARWKMSSRISEAGGEGGGKAEWGERTVRFRRYSVGIFKCIDHGGIP